MARHYHAVGGPQVPRASIFQEVGLDDFDSDTPVQHSATTPNFGPRRRATTVRFRSKDDIHVYDSVDNDEGMSGPPPKSPSTRARLASRGPSGFMAQRQALLFPRSTTIMYRFGAVFLILCAAFPFMFSHTSGRASMPLQPVSGGPIPDEVKPHGSVVLDRRADSPTDVCFRWAQQSAVVNGTLYLYGGEASDSASQDSNTWNNNFLSLDLTHTWQIASPSLTGLPQPSGPPNVSLGYLFNTHESLFLYGGEFSWKPPVSPSSNSVWEYNIASSSWIEHSDPQTSSGASAPSDSQPVQRSAEGAGVNIPSLGRGYYFGGHLDGYTTEGWSQSIPRVYLQSLLEFTFPGYTNNQVNALSDNKDAGPDGVYRNITQGGLQDSAGFTKRADGLLIYVPGFGAQGILLALAGGTNETYTQMNNINVYDIANSSWYIQSTSGPTPKVRVNPCAVIAAAPDGSSYNIYMFGGQNLIPYGDQAQYNEMWILTLPSFTWIEVDQSGQSVPYGRSGHTCNVWDAQMVMVGGYLGNESLTCESPGIYVYDLSAAEWVNQFTATSPGADDGGSENSSGGNSTGANNPFNQQLSQKASGDNFGGLEGSYGYTVPQAVIDIVGGDKSGGATLTTPVNTATAGPLATGKPVTYTVTNADGSTTSSTTGPNSSNNQEQARGKGVNVGAIVAGCVAGFFFLLACYLAFCSFVYRKQVQLYKRHVEMAQAQARGEKVAPIPGLLATNAGYSSEGRSSDRATYGDGSLRPWMTDGSDRGSSERSSGQRDRFGGAGYSSLRRSSEVSADGNEDLLAGREPTFVGVMLNPRRSLRVINRD